MYKTLQTAALALLVLFSFTRCSFDRPSAPSWDLEVAIPLISKSYTMAELAEDEGTVQLDSSGLVRLDVEAELDSFYVGDQLTLRELRESFDLQLGTFNVNPPGSEATQVALREIFSQAETFDGQTVIVPGFSFTSEKKILDPFSNYTYVHVDSGRLDIRVNNGLPIPLGSPLTLEVWNSVTDTLVLTKTRAVRVNPGESRVILVNLTNVRLPNALSVRIIGDSPGSEGSPVTVDADDTFEIVAKVGKLKVREALAEIPAHEVSRTDSVVVDEPVEIRSAEIEQGLVDLSITANLPVDAWITYRLPDFVREDGTALVDSFFLARNQTTNISIDLSDVTLSPAAADIGAQKIAFEWTARTVDTGAQRVLVRSTDFVAANLNLSEVRFSRITGRLGEKEIDISQRTIEFDIPVELDSVFFETATLELLINNGINFPASLDFMIEGENESGSVAQLEVRQTIQSAPAPGVPAVSSILLTQDNSNIQEFISILPNLLRVFGSATLGDANWLGTVSKDDFISGTVRLTAPLALSLPPQQVDSDVNEVKIDQSVKNDIRDNLSSGTFYIEVSNHLPLGASVEFLFAPVQDSVFTAPALKVGPVVAAAGLLDTDGYVQDAQDSDVTLNLTEEQMKTFLEDFLYAGVRISVDGTNGQFVKVRGTDYINVKAYSKIKVKVNR